MMTVNDEEIFGTLQEPFPNHDPDKSPLSVSCSHRIQSKDYTSYWMFHFLILFPFPSPAPGQASVLKVALALITPGGCHFVAVTQCSCPAAMDELGLSEQVAGDEKDRGGEKDEGK